MKKFLHNLAVIICVLIACSLTSARLTSAKVAAAMAFIADGITLIGASVVASDYIAKFNQHFYKDAVFGSSSFKTIAKQLQPDVKIISEAIKASGEKGMLLDVLIYEKGTGNDEIEYVLAAVLPNGFGMNPGDAANKAQMSEDKIYNDGLLNTKIVQLTMADKSFTLSDLSFGIWLELKDDGTLNAKTVPDMKKYALDAALSWKLHKGILLQTHTKNTLDSLSAASLAYEKIAKDYDAVARSKNVIGTLNRLKNAQEEMASKMAQAEALRQKAFERYEKYKSYGELAAVLSLAGSAVGAFEESKANAAAQKDYYEASIKTISVDLKNKRIEFNEFSVKVLKVKPETLPSPEVPIYTKK